MRRGTFSRTAMCRRGACSSRGRRPPLSACMWSPSAGWRAEHEVRLTKVTFVASFSITAMGIESLKTETTCPFCWNIWFTGYFFFWLLLTLQRCVAGSTPDSRRRRQVFCSWQQTGCQASRWWRRCRCSTSVGKKIQPGTACGYCQHARARCPSLSLWCVSSTCLQPTIV